MGWLSRNKGKEEPRGTPSAPSSPMARHAAALYPDMPAEGAEDRLARSYAHVLAHGFDLDARIVAESAILADMDPEDLAARFENTPLPRIDPYPEDPVACLDWLEDVLRSEHADLVAGRISFANALRIAAFPRGDVPAHIAGQHSAQTEGARRRSEEDTAAQAGQIARMPTQFLRNRFRDVPGVAEGEIPDPHQTQDRIDWISLALQAEETRQLGDLPSLRRTGSDWISDLRIQLHDIDLVATPEGLLSFTGTILVDGSPLCAISSPGDGTYEVAGWAEGCTQQDLHDLQTYVAVSAPERTDEEGTRSTYLIDVLFDQVISYCTVMRYRDAAEEGVMFCPDLDDEFPEIYNVPTPQGGTREEAVGHVRASYPNAVILDDLLEEDAALLWATLT